MIKKITFLLFSILLLGIVNDTLNAQTAVYEYLPNSVVADNTLVPSWVNTGSGTGQTFDNEIANLWVSTGAIVKNVVSDGENKRAMLFNAASTHGFRTQAFGKTGTALLNSSNISLDFWIKPLITDTNDHQIIWETGSHTMGLEFFLDNSGTAPLVTGVLSRQDRIGEDIVVSTEISATEFTYISLTVDLAGKQLNMYKNGVETPVSTDTGLASVTYNAWSSADNAGIGKIGGNKIATINSAPGEHDYLSAYLGALRIYSGILTTTEMNSVYTLGLPVDAVILGVDDYIDDNLFGIYPNPAQNVVNISSKLSMNTIEVYSSIGQKVKSKVTSDTSVNIKISDLPTGIYFLKIHTEDGFSIKRLIKE